MLPAQSLLWSSIGPFPALDVTKAYTTAFEPEKDIKDEPLDLKKSYTKVVLPPPTTGAAEKSAPAARQRNRPVEKTPAKKEDQPRAKDASPTTAAKVSPAPGAAPSDGKPPSTKPAGEPRKKPISPAGAGAGQATKTEQTGKPGPEAGKDSKGNAVAAAEKPAPEATKEAKAEAKPEAATAMNKEASKPDTARRKPEKITWVEQRTWRDGTAARLQGASSAYYLSRKIVSTRPRTAMVRIDGPARLPDVDQRRAGPDVASAAAAAASTRQGS